MAPDLLITIDTEADNEWDSTCERSFANIQRLPEFQEVCDRHGARPTYLVTYDVLQDDPSRETLLRLARRGNCEIGAHLHAWSTPPEHELMPGFFRHSAYLHEFPQRLQAEKLANLSEAITSAFGREPRSYRGGRWSFDGHAAALLTEGGYLVDSTVTPGVTWQANPGYSPGAVGNSYAGAPRDPYMIDPEQVTVHGRGELLEVPVSIMARGGLRHLAQQPSQTGALSPLNAIGRRVLHKSGLCRLVWLRPGYSSMADMVWACDELCRQAAPVLNLMFHSSELIAGGSPRIKTPAAARQFAEDLEGTIAYATGKLGCRGMTLTDFAREWLEARVPMGVASEH
jgi:hypothetical protein